MVRGLVVVCGLLLTACPKPSGTDAGNSSSGGLDAAVARDAAPALDAAVGMDRPDLWDGAGRCGPVTEDGECNGTVLSYCEGTTVRTTDCAERGRTCAAQTDLGGFWCVGGLGAVCDVNDTDVCETAVACLQGVCGGAVLDAGMDGGGATDGGQTDGAVDDGGASDAAVPSDAGQDDASPDAAG